VIGIDARLAEIDDLLQNRGHHAAHCECGAPVLRGSHFCPNCGRSLPGSADGVSEETVLESAPKR
jgi:uncharacterized Zn finger protein (UPF0148 family)